MKKYLRVENIIFMLFPLAALIIAIVQANTLAVVIAGAFTICSAGVVYLLTRAIELGQDNLNLTQQLDEVRRNRDDYMALYKEYWNKYDAKVSECKILEHTIQELQDQLAISEMKEPVKQEETKEVQKTPRKRQAKGKKSVQEIKTDLLEKRVD